MRDLQIGQRPVFVDGERDFDLRLIPDIVAIGRKPQVADHPDFEAFRTASLKRGVHLFGPKAGRRTGVFSGSFSPAVFAAVAAACSDARPKSTINKRFIIRQSFRFHKYSEKCETCNGTGAKKGPANRNPLAPYRAVRPGTRFPIRGTKAECPRRPPNRPRRPRWDPWRASAGSSRDRPSPAVCDSGRPSGRPKRRPNRSAD